LNTFELKYYNNSKTGVMKNVKREIIQANDTDKFSNYKKDLFSFAPVHMIAGEMGHIRKTWLIASPRKHFFSSLRHFLDSFTKRVPSVLCG
jgi:hypothetical protein